MEIKCVEDDLRIPNVVLNRMSVLDASKLGQETFIDVIGGHSIDMCLWDSKAEDEGSEIEEKPGRGQKPTVCLKGSRISDYNGKSIQSQISIKEPIMEVCCRKSQFISSVIISLGISENEMVENLEKYLEELKARHCEVSTKQPLDEDTFGMNDEDWHMYKQMDRDYKEEVEEDVDEDEAELSRLTSKLKEIDLSYTSAPPPGLQEIVPEFVIQRPLTEKDYQIVLGVERFRDILPACRSGGNCEFDGFNKRMFLERSITGLGYQSGVSSRPVVYIADLKDESLF
ncbi:hypothetical protein SELMODRAFT_427960 [Selaginella moellendorffii]|uniref:Uncharacterized protein n=1 Tax=Selaginella moellendorffii TaxID=88036 RepID=D8T192_SELML|nr:hypothetical protein SELMODRAFT_427960 [Selaginella moellendorffii]